MKLTQFDKPTLRILAAEMEAALSTIGQKYGMTIQFKGGTFSPQVWNTKVELVIGDKKEDPFFKMQQAHGLRVLGMPADSLGKRFTSQGKTFEIERVDLKKSKMPVIGSLVENGTKTARQYKFTVEGVMRALTQLK